MERRQAGVLTQGREVRAREKGGLEGKGGLTLGRVWSSAGVCGRAEQAQQVLSKSELLGGSRGAAALVGFRIQPCAYQLVPLVPTDSPAQFTSRKLGKKSHD